MDPVNGLFFPIKEKIYWLFLEYSSSTILYYGVLNDQEAISKAMVEDLRQELETR